MRNGEDVQRGLWAKVDTKVDDEKGEMEARGPGREG
jgi:hypothetical protein